MGTKKTVHRELDNLRRKLKELQSKDDDGVSMRQYLEEFVVSCSTMPDISEDDLKRVAAVVAMLMKNYPASKAGRPRDLTMPASAEELTNLNDMIDEAYEPESALI